MSWWPSSGASADAKSQSQAQPTQSIPDNNANAPEVSQPSPPPPPPTSAPHDPDFYAAHPHLTPPSLSTPSSSDPASSTNDSSNDLDPTLPYTMSCRAAFDSAFYCSSLGGHFNDIYRYGQLRNCSEHWSDFWFCMRTKNSYSGRDVKERIIQERYREKEEKVRGKPNSENVWRVRGPGEEVRGAFGAKADE